jgi:thiol-disulfide isomerase/thioredoxin
MFRGDRVTMAAMPTPRLAVLLAFAGFGCGANYGGAAPARTPASPPPAIRGTQGQIALTTLDGRPTTLAAYGAPVTVVALWATYCTPCLEELPHLDALRRKYRGRRDVSVVAVNVDDIAEPSMRAEVKRMVGEMALEMPCLLGGMPVMERLTARDQNGQPRLALPLLVVIDPAFRIHRRFGFRRGISRDDYVAAKSALVEAALRGDRPENDLAPPQP